MEGKFSEVFNKKRENFKWRRKHRLIEQHCANLPDGEQHEDADGTVYNGVFYMFHGVIALRKNLSSAVQVRALRIQRL